MKVGSKKSQLKHESGKSWILAELLPNKQSLLHEHGNE